MASIVPFFRRQVLRTFCNNQQQQKQKSIKSILFLANSSSINKYYTLSCNIHNNNNHVVNKNLSLSISFRIESYYSQQQINNFSTKNKKGQKNQIASFIDPNIKVNEKIQASEMRITYIHPETGEKVNEIVSRSVALETAKNFNLDLILVSEKAKPIVCKIGDFKKESYAKYRDMKKNKKPEQKVKEMQFRGNIDEGDFRVKINKILKFLGDGHQCKILVVPTFRQMTSNPERTFEIEENILNALEGNYKGVTKSKRQTIGEDEDPNDPQVIRKTLRCEMVFSPLLHISKIKKDTSSKQEKTGKSE